MEHLLVGKAVNYGASKSNATARTTLTAADLADGSVGIFGLCVDGRTRLIVTASGTNTATTTTIASFTANTDPVYAGKKFYWAVGTSNGCLTTNPVEYKVNGYDVATRGKENELPLRQLSYVGYDPVDSIGTLNLLTPGIGDSISLNVNYSFIKESNRNIKNYDAGLLTTDAVYDQISKLSIAINKDIIVVADIVGAIGVEVAPVQVGGSYIFTKGSNIINNASASASTVVVGDFLRIQNLQPLLGASTGINTITAATTAANSIIYKVIAVGITGQSITLDRAYTGETQTVSVANFNAFVARITTLTTSLGIRLVGQANTNVSAYPKYTNFIFNFSGAANLVNATVYDKPAAGVTGFRGFSSGSGTTDHLLDLEKRAITFSGGLSLWADATLQWATGYVSRVDTTINNYDLYFTTFIPDIQISSTVGSATKGEVILLATAFPSATYGDGNNQFDYDALIRVLGQYTGNANAAA